MQSFHTCIRCWVRATNTSVNSVDKHSIKCIACVTGHFVFCSAGGQGSESTNDNFRHYRFIDEVSTLVNTALGTSLYSSTK